MTAWWKLGAVFALLCVPSFAFAGSAKPKDEIEAALSIIRSAALDSKVEIAAPILSDELVLISQSGKVYGKEAALFDLGNGFVSWDNSDIIVRDSGDTKIVTLINRRTRTNMDPARFRVVQMWQKRTGNWLMVMQSSVRLKE